MEQHGEADEATDEEKVEVKEEGTIMFPPITKHHSSISLWRKTRKKKRNDGR